MELGHYKAPVASALTSAGLLWIAGTGAWWLAWLALVPAAWAALSIGGRAGRVAVPLTLALYLETQLIPALPFGIAEGQWGDPPLPVMIGDSPVVVVALVAIPLVGLLLYLLPFAPPPHWPAGAAIGVPALTFAALEFVRANFDPGGLWGTLSLTQAGSPGGDVAALAGPWLLVFLIAALNYAVAFAIARSAPKALALAATVVATALIAGAAITGTGGSPIRVAAVQPGYDTAEEDPYVLRRWEPGSYPEAALDVIGDLAGLTAQAAEGGAQVVVWPEAATFVDPRDYPLVRNLAGRLASENDVAIVFPHFDYERSESAVSLVEADGELSLARPKHRPMWFLGERSADVDAGLLDAGDLEIGVLLGVDSQDADIAAELVDRGADLLVSATHDWQALASTQLDQARLLTQATGAGIARADWRYDSALVSPSGEVLGQADEGKRRALVIADVPSADPTPYAWIAGLIG